LAHLYILEIEKSENIVAYAFRYDAHREQTLRIVLSLFKTWGCPFDRRL